MGAASSGNAEAGKFSVNLLKQRVVTPTERYLADPAAVIAGLPPDPVRIQRDARRPDEVEVTRKFNDSMKDG